MSIPEKILSRLDSPKTLKDGQVLAKCPAHDDRHPSLFVKADKETGNVLLRCMAGCATQDVVEALGLEMKDLFAGIPVPEPRSTAGSVAYIYYDRSGRMVAKKEAYRNADGSKGFGWFRFEKERWAKGLNGTFVPLYNLPSLLYTDEPIYIAEGEKDATTLQRMGYTATTPPHGAGQRWDSKRYNEFFVDRDVVVLADNDDVGKKHAEEVAKCVSTVASSVKLIYPERIYHRIKEHGDISDIVAEFGEEEADEMLREAVEFADLYMKPHKVSCKLPGFCYENGESVGINAALLAMQIKEDGVFRLVKETATGNNNLWLYDNGRFCRCSDDVAKSVVVKYITDVDPGILKMSTVKEAIEIIKADSESIMSSEFNQDENIINFQNGILDLSTMELLKHSREVLSTIQIQTDWKKEAVATPVFDSYINTLTNGDAQVKKLLLQAIGLSISNIKGYRTKKALFLCGEGNTGKSQIRLLAEKIIGEEFCSSLDISDLETRFGPSALIGKRLSGSADLGFGTANQLKVLKQLVGGDTIQADQKFKDPVTFKFDGFLWFGTNRMPLFGGDKGSWVYERFIVVPCNNVVPPEKRDPFLLSKMLEEKEGIVQQAVSALQELISNGYKFTIPDICNAQLDEFKKTNSAAITFFDECCVMRKTEDGVPRDKCTITAMKRVFNDWCKDNIGGIHMSVKDFEREIAQHLGVSVDAIKKRTSEARYYVFTLNSEAMSDYSGTLNR